jgi:hypothetical protein
VCGGGIIQAMFDVGWAAEARRFSSDSKKRCSWRFSVVSHSNNYGRFDESLWNLALLKLHHGDGD